MPEWCVSEVWCSNDDQDSVVIFDFHKIWCRFGLKNIETNCVWSQYNPRTETLKSRFAYSAIAVAGFWARIQDPALQTWWVEICIQSVINGYLTVKTHHENVFHSNKSTLDILVHFSCVNKSDLILVLNTLRDRSKKRSPKVICSNRGPILDHSERWNQAWAFQKAVPKSDLIRAGPFFGPLRALKPGVSVPKTGSQNWSDPNGTPFWTT